MDRAVRIARVAGEKWSEVSLKDRTQCMYEFRQILHSRLDTISHLISAESGKLVSEAKAGLLKGIEVLEFALSLQNVLQGERQEVSRGVYCETRREPLGVVAGITPFNFPAMVSHVDDSHCNHSRQFVFVETLRENPPNINTTGKGVK